MIYYAIESATSRGIEVTEFYAGSYEKKITLAELLAVDVRRDPLNIIVNFSWASSNIIEYLLTQTDYKQRTKAKEKSHVFEVFDNYISVWVGDDYVMFFCDYCTKYLQDFIDFETAAKLDAVDTDRKPTAAQDARHAFYASFNENIPHAINTFLLRYPQLSGKEQIYCTEAKAYTAGVIYAKEGKYNNIHSYDVKNSYPSRLLDAWTPYEKGIYFERDEYIPERYWYTKRIRIYSIEPIYFDFLQLMPKYKGKPFSVSITKECEEILNKYYKCAYRTLNGFYYKCRRNAFDSFLLRRINDPRNSFKPIRQYRKAQCNSLIGTFGAKIKLRKCFSVKGKTVAADLTDEESNPKCYYPVYLFVTGRAKLAFCEFAARVWDKVVYCHTDSLMLTQPRRALQWKPADTPGFLEYRALYVRFAVKEVNNYCGEYIDGDGVVQTDIRLSGRIHDNPSYNEFIAGYDVFIYRRYETGFVIKIPHHEPAIGATSYEVPFLKQSIEL